MGVKVGKCVWFYKKCGYNDSQHTGFRDFSGETSNRKGHDVRDKSFVNTLGMRQTSKIQDFLSEDLNRWLLSWRKVRVEKVTGQFELLLYLKRRQNTTFQGNLLHQGISVICWEGWSQDPSNFWRRLRLRSACCECRLIHDQDICYRPRKSG